MEANSPLTTVVSPPPVSTPVAVRTELSAGIDGPRNGFNPHLLADSSAFVDSLASLVLPSAFRLDSESGKWAMDTTLLDSAQVISPRGGQAQTVRYEINSAAQWSDGTPVTGNDFQYLWRSMLNTPAVVDRAGYGLITAIRVTGGGKIVEVDFSHPFQAWPSLFSNLLPAHLVQGRSFAEALKQGIPASAGRYAVQAVDRARGIIRLKRNDRFWGPDPAVTEVLILRTLKTSVEGTDQIRTGQISYVDITPVGTALESYGLLPNTQTRTVDSGRQLQLTASVNSPILRTPSLRAEFFSLLDIPQIGRIAAAREHPISSPAKPESLKDYSITGELATAVRQANRVLTIAADPADPVADSAARVIIDQLAAHGISAQVLSSDLGPVAANALRNGEVDAVVSWGTATPDVVDLASSYGCEVREITGRGSNLAGFCSQDIETVLLEALAGSISLTQAKEYVRQTEETNLLNLGLLNETRLWVLGPTLEGTPSLKLEEWKAGLETATSWRKVEGHETEPNNLP